MTDALTPLAPGRYIIFAGRLQKKRTGQIRAGWVERFFVLTADALHYFRQPKVVRLVGVFGEERAIIALRDIRTIDERRRETDGRLTIAMTTSAPHHPTIQLCHVDEDTVVAWRAALVGARDEARRAASGGTQSSGAEDGDDQRGSSSRERGGILADSPSKPGGSSGGSEGGGQPDPRAHVTAEAAPKQSILLKHHKRAKHALGALMKKADIGGALHALLDGDGKQPVHNESTSFFPVPLAARGPALVSSRARNRNSHGPVEGTGICAMGYLLKRGPMSKQTLRGSRGIFGGGTRWTHRFFVLTPNALLYFRRDEPQDELFGERRSVLLLSNIASISMGTIIRSKAGRETIDAYERESGASSAMSSSSAARGSGGGFSSGGDFSAASAPLGREEDAISGDAIVISMTNGERYELRSKLAAPSTLGKSVLIAWESVLSQRLAAVRGDGVLLALDEQGATSQRPLAHGRHSRKSSFANIVLDGLGAAAASAFASSTPPPTPREFVDARNLNLADIITSRRVRARANYVTHARRSAVWLLCALLCSLLGLAASRSHRWNSWSLGVSWSLINLVLMFLWPARASKSSSSTTGAAATTSTVVEPAATKIGAQQQVLRGDSGSVDHASGPSLSSLVTKDTLTNASTAEREAAAAAAGGNSGHPLAVQAVSVLAPSGATIVPRCHHDKVDSELVDSDDRDGEDLNINQHEMAWAETDAAYFKVRAKGYRKSRTKEPSAESLYEPIDVATFHFEDVSCHVAPRVFEGAMSPTILRVRERMRRKACGEEDVDGDEGAYLDHLIATLELDVSKASGLPLLMVVNMQVPASAPAMWGSGEGSGWSIVIYFALKKTTATAASDLATAAPCVSLFHHWATGCTTNDKLRQQFKLIGMVHEMEQFGFGQFIESYNGKPVLVTRSGSIFAGTATTTAGTTDEQGATESAAGEYEMPYLELDINFFKWNKLARITFYQLINKVSAMDLRIAFVVQGNTDETQPECVLGCLAARHFNFGKIDQGIYEDEVESN